MSNSQRNDGCDADDRKFRIISRLCLIRNILDTACTWCVHIQELEGLVASHRIPQNK